MGNMFKATKAKSVAAYIAAVPKERKEAIMFLHAFIQKSVPKLKSHFAYNMLGYGSFPYQSYKKELLQWPIIALANQKNYISLYVCALEDGEYLAEKYQSKLGKVSTGKSCIRFKNLKDVNMGELKKLLRKAAKKPGLISAGE